MLRRRRRHPLEVHPSFRAALAAAPPLAELARELRDDGAMFRALAIACGELAAGFYSPAHSVERRAAHHRAWANLKELDRQVSAARLGRLAPAPVVAKAQRAIDRAELFVSDLPGVVLA